MNYTARWIERNGEERQTTFRSRSAAIKWLDAMWAAGLRIYATIETNPTPIQEDQ